MSQSPGAEPMPVPVGDFTVPAGSPAAPPPQPGPGPRVPFVAPPPPPGPGVRVPFAAPPTERDRRRTWIGLGVGGAVLLLCCVGGVFGIGALVVSTNRAQPVEARTAVTDFLHGLADSDYGKAYDQLCGSVQRAESEADFRRQQLKFPAVRTYTVENGVRIGTQFQVAAEVGNSSGQISSEIYTVRLDSHAGELRVCAGPRVI